jgi:hypothetical protein
MWWQQSSRSEDLEFSISEFAKKELSISNILRSTEDILSSVSNIQKANRGRLIILFLMLGRSVGGVQG